MIQWICDRLGFDHTFCFGPFYLDVCGGIEREIRLGLTISFHSNPNYCWGRRIGLDLLFWTISLGVD